MDSIKRDIINVGYRVLYELTLEDGSNKKYVASALNIKDLHKIMAEFNMDPNDYSVRIICKEMIVRNVDYRHVSSSNLIGELVRRGWKGEITNPDKVVFEF